MGLGLKEDSRLPGDLDGKKEGRFGQSRHPSTIPGAGEDDLAHLALLRKTSINAQRLRGSERRYRQKFPGRSTPHFTGKCLVASGILRRCGQRVHFDRWNWDQKRQQASTLSPVALLSRSRGQSAHSDHIWGNDLSETITQCLRKQLEQLQGLTEALGRLCLSSSPDGSGEPLATSTCPVKCVCYGLGNFASCVTARSQLAFMLVFLEKCQIPRSRCWVYDPLFSQAEVSVLASLGVTVLSENEEGKHSIQGQPTVFYMPHCGTALYNNLLWSNWSIDALSRIVIIGNSFQGLEERLLARILQKNYAYIEKVSWRSSQGEGGDEKPHSPLMFLSIMYWQGLPWNQSVPNSLHSRGESSIPLPLGLKSIEIQIPIA
ncbi:uncharacterized protein LOC118572570 [Onychomys torridus]|uniref:uncharacterized protein LOC118572570 n=1 Tax=Onychomys torridus TaxID=38674 RepID=UPI00167F2EDD|nr:uncharacterized protein LOC118572570 [Onychomys torridus]